VPIFNSSKQLPRGPLAFEDFWNNTTNATSEQLECIMILTMLGTSSYIPKPPSHYVVDNSQFPKLAPNGDLNNTGAMRVSKKIRIDPAFSHHSLAPTAEQDGNDVRSRYRPFILNPSIEKTDWVSRLELATVTKLASENLSKTGEALRVLVLYGSLRSR
jgi:hypothetical protein